jgi:hypothetical protein
MSEPDKSAIAALVGDDQTQPTTRSIGGSVSAARAAFADSPAAGGKDDASCPLSAGWGEGDGAFGYAESTRNGVWRARVS